MATQPRLDPESELLIQQLVTSGRFADRAEVLRYGVRLVHDEDQAVEPLDAETIAMLEQRMAEADADPESMIPAEVVFADMERRCRDEIERRRTAAR